DTLVRSERVDAVDPASGAVLDSRTVSNFHTGTYLVWDVSGHIDFRFTVLGGYNAVLSGLFVDPAAAPGGLNLMTTTTVDVFGRPTQVTDPKGNVSYYSYNDPNHECRIYHWDVAAHQEIGPTEVVRSDLSGYYRETL